MARAAKKQTVSKAEAKQEDVVPVGANLIAHHAANMMRVLESIEDKLAAFLEQKPAVVKEEKSPSMFVTAEGHSELVTRVAKLDIATNALLEGLAARVVVLENAMHAIDVEKFFQELTARIAKLEGKPAAAPVLDENGQPVKRGPGRPRKNPLPAAEVVATAAPVLPPGGVTVVPAAPTYVPPNPCPGCGADLNVEPVVHSGACPALHPAVAAPEPVAAPAPATLDDVRAVAITFAGKHGKEKLAEVLKKYGADRLSAVAEEQRSALMVALQNGAL